MLRQGADLLTVSVCGSRGARLGMALINTNAFGHVRLTVTDIDASKAFYDRVFGWEIAIDNSARVDELRESQEDFYGGVVYQIAPDTLLGLRPVAPAGQSFDSEHTGLDHLSFAVADRAALDAAHDALEAAGITHGSVTAMPGGAFLSFDDPDGIHLELTAPEA